MARVVVAARVVGWAIVGADAFSGGLPRAPVRVVMIVENGAAHEQGANGKQDDGPTGARHARKASKCGHSGKHS